MTQILRIRGCASWRRPRNPYFLQGLWISGPRARRARPRNDRTMDIPESLPTAPQSQSFFNASSNARAAGPILMASGVPVFQPGSSGRERIGRPALDVSALQDGRRWDSAGRAPRSMVQAHRIAGRGFDVRRSPAWCRAFSTRPGQLTFQVTVSFFFFGGFAFDSPSPSRCAPSRRAARDDECNRRPFLSGSRRPKPGKVFLC